MALSVHWYDCFIFAILLGAVVASIWMIWNGGRRRTRTSRTKYESLLAVAVPSFRGELAGASETGGRLSADQFWRSCWRGVHPAWLLLFRFVVVVAMAGILISDILAYGFSIFIYYTEWTFTLVIVYFAIGTVISAHGCWSYAKQYAMEVAEAKGFLKPERNGTATLTTRMNIGKDTTRLLQDGSDQERSDESSAGFWGHTMLIVYQTCAGGVVVTDLVFWAVLVPFLKSNVNSIMICMHTLNAVSLLSDTAMNDLPLPWFGIAYFVLWSCIYVSFQWILHAYGLSWWPYPFLELGTPWAIAWYFCMALVHIPCYGFYWLVVGAKNKFLPRLFPNAYIRSS